ncbi:hypothetical protein Tco_1384692 [Tanacetum coccineum]
MGKSCSIRQDNVRLRKTSKGCIILRASPKTTVSWLRPTIIFKSQAKALFDKEYSRLTIEGQGFHAVKPSAVRCGDLSNPMGASLALTKSRMEEESRAKGRFSNGLSAVMQEELTPPVLWDEVSSYKIKGRYCHDDCSFQDDGIDDHQVNTASPQVNTASPQVNTGSREISTADSEVNTATSEGLMGPIS